MKRRTLAALCVVAVSAGLAPACTSSKSPAAPTAPAPSSTSSTDGATLKVSTPTPVSSVNDAVLDQLNQTVTLTATGVSSTYGSSTAAVQYDFELYDPSNTKISTQVMPGPAWNIPVG